MKIQSADQAVSPAISVILLVAVTVALVSLVSVSAFNSIDQTVEEKADATVDFSFQEDNGTNRIGYLNIEISSNQNVESIEIETPSGNTTELSKVGQEANMTIYNKGTAFAKAKDKNFNQVITKIEIENS